MLLPKLKTDTEKGQTKDVFCWRKQQFGSFTNLNLLTVSQKRDLKNNNLILPKLI